MTKWTIILLIILKMSYFCNGIERGDLFPFGREADDDSLHAGTDGSAEDVSSEEIALGTNVKFYQREYGAIYVRHCK
jgi:hypothetical protein